MNNSGLFIISSIFYLSCVLCPPQSGKYYADCREKEPRAQGQDDETAKKLWDITAKAVGL